jgi:hypothetical protein
MSFGPSLERLQSMGSGERLLVQSQGGVDGVALSESALAEYRKESARGLPPEDPLGFTATERPDHGGMVSFLFTMVKGGRTASLLAGGISSGIGEAAARFHKGLRG